VSSSSTATPSLPGRRGWLVTFQDSAPTEIVAGLTTALAVHHERLHAMTRRVLAGQSRSQSLPGVTTIASISAASASLPTAVHTRSQYLTNNPKTSMPKSCTNIRLVPLDAGKYLWTTINPISEEYNARFITLAKGTYQWQDCLVPKTGPQDSGATNSGYYVRTSTLTPNSFTGDTATLVNDDIADGTSGAARYRSRRG
jgi:hypothetical protein